MYADVMCGSRRRRLYVVHAEVLQTRSVRVPEALWVRMDAQARAKGMNLHQAMRAALLGWIRRAG
jgi:hypothetical protein